MWMIYVWYMNGIWMIYEWYMNDIWMIYEWYMNDTKEDMNDRQEYGYEWYKCKA